MLKNKSSLSIDNAQKDDVIGIFIPSLGEIICRIEEVNDTDVTVRNPYRFMIQENGIALAPVGSFAAIIEQQDDSAPPISINKSSIVYVINVPEDIADSYKEKTSGIEIARGNVESMIQHPNKSK